MDASEYGIYIEKPQLKKLKRAKFGFDLILICSCGVAAVWCSNHLSDLKTTMGDVSLSAGLLPLLLSLPVVLADFFVSVSRNDYKNHFCSKLGQALSPRQNRVTMVAYFSYV